MTKPALIVLLAACCCLSMVVLGAMLAINRAQARRENRLREHLSMNVQSKCEVM